GAADASRARVQMIAYSKGAPLPYLKQLNQEIAMTPPRAVPPRIRTARLVLRRQHPDDAGLVKEAVDSSLAHLKSSVAWAQTAPWPLRVQSQRLAASAAAFDAGLAWAFSILDSAESRILGGLAIEPAEAALAELVGEKAFETGYWLREDATGQG